MMSLRARLEALIAQEGPLTAAQWMEHCLHDPQGGYYATRPALGAEGDFVTAPLVSQMFGELLGLWCAAVWEGLGRPSPVRWVELGPGDGTLMVDARRAAARAAPAFLAAADLVLVERSVPLRERQRAALGGTSARWAQRLDEVEGGAPVILLANELLDCLPARQFVRTERGWAERRVGLGPEAGFAWGLAPAPGGFVPRAAFTKLPMGTLIEVSPAQEALGADIGARIVRDGGAALLIDYGSAAPQPGDTLQALRRHRKVDPLADPGEADLTVHADFFAVAAAAHSAGAQTALITQAELLRRLGIEARARTLSHARPDQAEVIGRQLHRLTASEEMGELFKALAIFPPGGPPPAFG